MNGDVWVRESLVRIEADPASIRRLFPMVTRKVGAGHEQVRARLLRACPTAASFPASTVTVTFTSAGP